MIAPMNPYAIITAFILAGGKSTRMGTDKAFVTLDGRTLLARMLELGRSVSNDVRIVGNPEKFAPFAPVIQDVYPDCGPLGGIHAALQASSTDLNLILAVDTPFIPPTFMLYLIQRARESHGKESQPAVVTAPFVAGRWQPLCAVYRREFAGMAEKTLREGHYKIGALFAETRTQLVSEDDLQTAGFSPRMFRNLNTPEELLAAKEP